MAKVIVLALLLVGCSAVPDRPNPWADLKLESESASPAELPISMDVAVEDLVDVLSPGEASALRLYGQIAESNTEIASQLSVASDELTRAYNGLVDAGSAEHELAEMRLVMLEEERRARRWDKLSYWWLLGLIGVGAVAQ